MGCVGYNKRCFNGTCHTCDYDGSYDGDTYGMFLFNDGCDGCAEQGGKACWRRGPYGASVDHSCTDTCNDIGGGNSCVQADWDDNALCDVVSTLWNLDYYAGSWSCKSRSNSYIPAMEVWASAVYAAYRGIGSQNCDAVDPSGAQPIFARVCVCQW